MNQAISRNLIRLFPFSRIDVGITMFILTMPFLMMFWMLPFVSSFTIGNDYGLHNINNQIELMFSIKTGSFPLYIPGFAGGQTASALTNGQLFNPLSYIASLMPGYWDGMAMEWVTFFRLISIGFAHLVLFLFLRNINFSSPMGFMLSTITVYNLRMLDLFRYGASIMSWTGIIFLCSAIGFYCLKPAKGWRPLAIIGATYWLVCSGHPQMMYYGLFGAGLFTMVLPFLLSAVLFDRQPAFRDTLRFWLAVISFCGIGLLLSSAYTLPFYFDFVLTNEGRVGLGYNWADSGLYRDTLIGTFNNFILPLRTDVHGAFGGSPLFFVAAIIPFLRLFKVKIPAVIWIIWGIVLLAFLHIQGGRTPVHYLAWKYLPFASSFRVGGRIALILPVFFLLLFIWLISTRQNCHVNSVKKLCKSPTSLLCIIAVLLTAFYLFLPDSILQESTFYWAMIIRRPPFWVEPVATIMAGLILLLFMAHGYVIRYSKLAEILLCVLTCFHLALLLHYGTWMKAKQRKPSYSSMMAQKENKLLYHAAIPGYGLANQVVSQQMRRSFLEPFLGKVYPKIKIVGSTEGAYSFMEKSRKPDQIVIESVLPDPNLFTAGNEEKDFSANVRLAYASYNRMKFNISSSAQSFFGFSYPYSENWQATVNGKKVQIYRANGGSQAVKIPAGKSNVEFRYWSPAAFAGVLISCITLFLIGLFFGFYYLERPKGLFVGLLFIVMSGLLFYMWFNSLYSGKNFNTQYEWKTENNPSHNMAYGKKTRMSSVEHDESPYVGGSGEAVNGDRNITGSTDVVGTDERTVYLGCALTALEMNPMWMVDLNSPEEIGSIVVYFNQSRINFNQCPLYLMFSNNAEDKYGIPIKISNGRFQITFKKPPVSRFVMIQGTGKCQLAIDEVEIYSSEK